MRQDRCCGQHQEIKDHGAAPMSVNIGRLAKMNTNYRTALWTGKHLQVTLMSIPAGGDIGLEIHADTDQFIRIESGQAFVLMGKCKDDLDYRQKIGCDHAVMIPAGTWHNIVNAGSSPLKLCSVYSPVQHPFGTVQRTKQDAERDE